MNDIIASIVSTLSSINFVDRIGGIVIPLTVNKNIGDGIDGKILPVALNSLKGTCNPSRYESYNPDSTKKSVLYFENNGHTVLSDNMGFITKQLNVRLVAWFNLPKINSTLTDADDLKDIIISTMPEWIANVGNASGIRILLTGEEVRSPAIFSAYSYDEAEKQYLIYPFDYFALNYQITYRVGKGCTDDIIINPSSC